MSKLVIACVLTLVATAANAQADNSGQTQAPAPAGVDEARLFLFDGRMIGDGKRPKATPRE